MSDRRFNTVIRLIMACALTAGMVTATVLGCDGSAAVCGALLFLVLITKD